LENQENYIFLSIFGANLSLLGSIYEPGLRFKLGDVRLSEVSLFFMNRQPALHL